MRRGFHRSSLAFFQFFILSLFSYFPIHHRFRCDDLTKWRYGKLSANHDVTDLVPVAITSVDNLADFALPVKNQVPNVTIRPILLLPSKIWYPGLIIRLITLSASKIWYPTLIIRCQKSYRFSTVFALANLLECSIFLISFL
jgi:hypothetical protein